MPSDAKTDRLTVGNAVRDLGFFYGLFVTIVNGPSFLSLFQMVFLEHRLVDSLQWIVDGYNAIVAFLGVFFEPLLQPALDWANRVFDWDLHLHAHWRALFVLSMVLVLGLGRTIIQYLKYESRLIVYLPALALGAAAGAIGGGLVPLDGNWLAQGAMAAAPVGAMVLASSIGVVSDNTGFKSWAHHLAAFVLRGVLPLTLVAFCAGAGLSPLVHRGAGIVAITGVLVAIGMLMLAAAAQFRHEYYGYAERIFRDHGHSDAETRRLLPDLRVMFLFNARLGFAILGGFFTAALIVAASAMLKAMG